MTPVGVAVGPDGTRAYVVNSVSNTVSVIDTATNTVTGTIPVGALPVGVAVSPDGTRAYVTNQDANTVSIIDTASNSVIGTIAGFVQPGYPGVCGNGNALLAAGRTFHANNGGAIGCTMTGPGTGPVFSGGTMQITGAGVSSALPVFLGPGGGTVDTQANSATFSGIISGPGSLTKIGTGTLILSGDNSYSGATFVNQGTLRAGAAGTFSPDSAINVASGAVLDLASFDQTIGSLAGGGNVLLGAGVLTTGGDGSSTMFARGHVGDWWPDQDWWRHLHALRDNLDSSYSGPTSVGGGTLVVNGSIAASVVTVNPGAVLRGDGILGGLSLGGTLAPGNSIGTLHVFGNATFAAGSTYEVEINAAGQSDLLAVTGTVTLSGGEVVVLNAPGLLQRRHSLYHRHGRRRRERHLRRRDRQPAAARRGPVLPAEQRDADTGAQCSANRGAGHHAEPEGDRRRH